MQRIKLSEEISEREKVPPGIRQRSAFGHTNIFKIYKWNIKSNNIL